MNELEGLRVVVAGAGAVGSVVALVLARKGAAVTLADPDPGGLSASAVAAGMLAPLSEALLDKTSQEHFVLFKAARDLWPALLEGVPDAPGLDRSGAYLRVADPAAALVRATALGAALEDTGRHVLFTPEDWRLEPRPMLKALHGALLARGGRIVTGRATGLHAGAVTFDEGPALPADALVLATGIGGGGLEPIKGQILRFPGLGPGDGPVQRGPGFYAAPSAGGLVVGATMEEGRSDLDIDPEAVARLKAAAGQLVPGLAEAPYEAFAGVRAATPDGLPLVGPAGGAGVIAARGARRNGWLLAPLIAQVVAEHLEGGPRSQAARLFDPARFSTLR